MNRAILRIAIPNIISNITVPIMGIVSTAIAGHLEGNTALLIGELAIGVSIFNLIYWSSSFIRMGTSGLTAQAFGRGDFHETSRMLIRALSIAFAMGLVIIIFRNPVASATVGLMNGGDIALEYTRTRIWAIPAGIMLFAFHGWFNGMQNAIIPMSVAIFINALHVALSFLFANRYDMGVVGIAMASVVSQWVGVAISLVLLAVRYGRTLILRGLGRIFGLAELRELLVVNRDIIIRTACNVTVHFTFTAFSARMGDANILAMNALLFEFFILSAYMTDGFAYAAEALTGRFVGAKDRTSLVSCVQKCLRWSIFIGIGFVAVYLIGWRSILDMFMADGESHAAILNMAADYIWWIILIPIISAVPFMIDGVMVGATITNIMRNSMLWSTAAYFATYYALLPLVGNNALWCAFTLHIIVRGAYQYFKTDRLTAIYNRAQ